ncbi:MAG TPA: hypothetical protein VGG74_14770 [Kofleriaceae bacterium]
MSPQERERTAYRQREAEKAVARQEFAEDVAAGKYRVAAKQLAQTPVIQRADLWASVHVDHHLPFLRAGGEPLLAILEPAIGKLAAENLRVDVLPDDELPDVVYVSGPSRSSTGTFEVAEDELDELEAAGIAVTSQLDRRPVAHEAPARTEYKPGNFKDGNVQGFVTPVDVVDRDAPRYRYFASYPFGYGAAKTITRKIPVSLGANYPIEYKEVTEPAGESAESIPRPISRAAVAIMQARSRAFAARAVITEVPVEEKRRLARLDVQRTAMQRVGGLGALP